MADTIYPFALITNLSWDGSGPLMDQIRGRTFGISGHGTGDFIAEQVEAIAYDTNSKGRIPSRSSFFAQKSYTFSSGDAVSGVAGKLDQIRSITGYEITLTDGTVLTQDALGGADASLLINIFNTDGGRRVWIDFDNTVMNVLNENKQIASIFISEDATDDFTYKHIELSAYNEEYTPTCFASGTMIRTQKGLRSVETLVVGDMVLTVDNGLQPIRWIGSCHLSSEELANSPKFKPIRIGAGRLGLNTPTSDLTVSPQNRILVRSKVAQRMFNADEVLVAAKHLLGFDGIEIVQDMSEIDYFHILFDQHEVILSNGAETESYYTGTETIKSLSPAARDEIFKLFPDY